MKKSPKFKTQLALLACSMMSVSVWAQVDVTATSGTPSATYTTLGAAFTAINSGTHTGAISISLTGDVTETASAVLNASGSGSASYTGVTITPAGARTISGAMAAGVAMIDLNGADNVVFDGLNAGGNSLTISNTGTGSTAGTSTIRFINDATGNTITNCTVLGAGTAATTAVSGTILFSNSAGTTGNDNNNITNNNIGDAGTTPSMAITSSGQSGTITNDNITVTGNNIYNFFNTGGATGVNILANSSAWTISSNKFYQTAARTGLASANYLKCIYVSTSSLGGYTINNNIIGYANAAGTGMLTNNGGRFTGIEIGVSATPVSNIQGNTISNINHTTASSAAGGGTSPFNGIVVNSGGVNIGTTTGNIIGLTTGTASATSGIYVISSNSGTGICAIYFTSTTPCTVQNNTIGGIATGGTAAIGYDFYGIRAAGSASHIITLNTIGNTTADNIAIGTTGTTTATVNFYGIYYTNGGTNPSVSNNTIQRSGTFGTGSGGFYGVYNNGSATTISMNSNTIQYCSNSQSGVFAGVYNNSSPTTTNINSNTIQNCSKTNTGGGSFYGVYNTSTSGTLNLNSNVIQNNSVAGTGDFYGVAWTSPSTFNANLNTITNHSRTGAGNSYGMYSGSSSTAETLTNNTISNITSTNGSASTIYGIRQNTASGTKAFQGNQVFNLSGNSGTTIYGIYIGYGTTIEISGNTVHDLTSTGGTSGTVTGIQSGTAGTTFNVFKNKIYNLSMSSTGGIVYGIVNGTSNANIYNNYIGDLSSTAFTTGTAPYIGVQGISMASGTVNLYNNTVYIGNVTSSGANFTAVGVYLNTSATSLMQNNLIVNLATPTGSGKAVAYQRSGTTLTSYAAASGYNSFYAGTPSASHPIFWDGTNVYQDMTAYKTAMATRDQFSVSVNPTFASTTGSATNYLHLPLAAVSQLESGGTTIASVTTDFDGDARPGPAGSVNGGGSAYDIGADEFDGVPSYTCTTPAPGNTIASANNICLGASVTLTLQNATAGTGVSYQWQSSPDNITYTDISGATSSSYTTAPLTSLYYRANVTCLAGPSSATSTPVQVTFANNITSTTPGTRCGAGTLSLSAAATAGTITWFDAASGGTVVGTGSPFTTPILSTTTNYYVGAQISTPVTIAVGAGGSTGTTAPYDYTNGGYGGMKTQYLYTAAELNAAGITAGNINSIAYEFTTVGSTLNGFNIQIGTSALTGFAAGGNIIGGLATVYTAASLTPTVGVNTYTLSSPFSWNGTSNIIVSISWSNGNTSNTSSTIKYDGTSFNSSQSYRKDSETAANMLAFTGATGSGTSTYDVSTNRPRTTFGANNICAGPRVQVVATIGASPVLTVSANQTVCNDAVAALSVTSTVGDYDSYVWAPATGLFTDAAGTVAYTGTSASTVYARTTTAGATTYTLTANNTATACSAIANSTVTVLPSAITITSSVASICISGSAVLSASPSTGFGAGSIQWQSSPDGLAFTDIASATNATYTTGTLSATTYYRVTVKNGATDCFNSAPFTMMVINPQVTGTTPGTHCGPGTVALGATGSTGTTLNWYASSSGGAILGTGTTFTTPSISTTTTYYVAAGNPPAVTATLGAGGTTASNYDGIFYHNYGGVQSQFLVRASELTAIGVPAGNISSLGINMSTVTTQAYAGFAVSMGTTASTDLSAGLFTGTLTPVYSAGSYTPVTGINTFTFGTPFTWDGVSNIVIKFCWSNNNSGGTGNYAKVDATPFVSAAWYRADGTSVAGICGGTSMTSSSSNRPQFIFNQAGCSSAFMPVVATITTAPSITAVSTPGTVCSGSAASLTASSSNSGYTYTWNPGTLTGATQSVTPSATTTYTLSAVDMSGGANDGCIASTVTTTVSVVPGVVNPTATATPATVCAGSPVTLGASANPVANTLLSENFNAATNGWTKTNSSTGGTTASAAWTLRPNNYAPGGYWASVAGVSAISSNDASQFYLTNSDAQGSGGTTNTILQSPVMSTVGYATLNLSFYNFFRFNATPDSANVEVSTNGTTWTRVNSFNGTGSTVGAATAFTQTTVNLNAYVGNPTFYVRFHYRGNWGYGWAIDNVVIAGTSAAFTYNWTSSPAGFTSTAAAPTANPTVNTDYQVTISNSFGCSATATASVTVNTPPTVAANVTATTVCAGGPVTFTGSGATSYTWTGGVTDGVAFTPASTNTYTVTGTDANGCTNTATTTVNVNTLPTVVANASASAACAGDGIIFTGSGATSYTWTGGVTDNVVFTPAATDTYTVTGTDANGCTNTATTTVTINALPTVAANTTASTVCGGTSVTLTGSGATTYTWSGTVTDGVAFTPSATETYTVTGTDGNSCENTATVTVTVNTLPTVVANTTATAVCDGGSVTLTGSGATTYTWSGTVADGVAFTPSATDTYTVTGTDGGCSNTATVTVTVNTLPTVTANTSAAVVCENTTVTLTGGGAVSYTWSGAVIDGVLFTPSATDTYTVTGTDGNTCQNTATVTVTVNTLPTVVANATATGICNGGSVTLTGSGATTYTWSGTVTDGVAFTPSATDTYTVTGTDGNTCQNTATVTVTVNAVPTVVANTSASAVCAGSDVTLTGSGATSYTWSGTVNDGVAFTPSATDTYTVTGTDGGCSNTATVTVTVNALPSVAMTPFTTSVCDNSTAFALTGGAPTGGVYSGTSVTGGMFDPTAAGAGMFVITYTVSDGTCSNADTATITVDLCSGIASNASTIQDISVYPNPTSGVVNIAISNANFTSLQVSITDIQGKLIYNELDTNVSAAYTKQINVETLAKGVYYIKLTTGTDSKVQKLVIN